MMADDFETMRNTLGGAFDKLSDSFDVYVNGGGDEDGKNGDEKDTEYEGDEKQLQLDELLVLQTTLAEFDLVLDEHRLRIP